MCEGPLTGAQVEYRYHQYFEFMCEENFVNFVDFLEEQITLYTL